MRIACAMHQPRHWREGPFSEGKRTKIPSEKTTPPNEKSHFSLGNAFFLH
jgi:hypothetical protein